MTHPNITLEQVEQIVQAIESLQGVDELHDPWGDKWTVNSRMAYLKELHEMVTPCEQS